MESVLTTLTEEQKQMKTLVKEFYEREVDVKRMQELIWALKQL